MNLRAAIVRALEAFQDGDQREAVEILLAALEEGDFVGAGHYPCAFCGEAFPWSGLRDGHEAQCAFWRPTFEPVPPPELREAA